MSHDVNKTTVESSDLIGQRKMRLEKVEKLKSMGIDPYPSKSDKQNSLSEISEKFDEFENKEIILAGRLVSWREHGALIFGHIQDQDSKLQLYIKEDTIEATNIQNQTLGFNDLNLTDIGDIIEAQGTVTKTNRGEISLLVKTIKILTKSIRPLPTEVKDKEIIFRQRYLDTILHPENKYRFQKFAEITFAIREFMNKKGFLEIHTPLIQPIYGGGLAKPFKTHVNALDVDYYLAISHELYLKRLITAGFENVFNIRGYFRNEGIDRTHNPEFTMLETMSAFKNFEFNMDLTEEMYKYITTKVFGKTTFKINGQEVDFGQKWERIQMIDAVRKYTGYDFNAIKTIEEAKEILAKEGFEPKETLGESMVELFKNKVEEKLIQPTFVYGHPVEISPLAKAMPSDKRFVERFEGFIGGIETGDNWSELNDPVELFNRFKDQFDRREGGEDETHPMDIEFIEMMEYGMPPTTGLGPGIERLTMMLTETEYIDDVLFFPMMRPAQVTQQQKDIYGEKYLVVDKENEVSQPHPQSLDLSKVPDLNIVKIEDDVKAKFEGIKTGYIVLENVKVEKNNKDLEALKAQVDKIVKNKYATTSDIKKSKNIEGFREIYKGFGVDPNSHLNSSEALLRRVVSGKGLYNINTVVDTYNATSVEFEVPMAAYDLDQIKGNIVLRFSKEGDQITKILETEPTKIETGELVYADDEGVTCMDFNYRDSDRTKITNEANRIIVFVDGHKDISQEEIEKVLSIVGARLEKFTGGKVTGKGFAN